MKKMIVLGALLFGVASSAAGADEPVRDEAFFRAAYEKLTGVVVSLRQADTAKVATVEIETIQTVIGQGQAYVAAARLRDAGFVLARADALSSLAHAKLRRHDLEDKARQAEAEAAAADQAAVEATTAADAVEARNNELEQKGL